MDRFKSEAKYLFESIFRTRLYSKTFLKIFRHTIIKSLRFAFENSLEKEAKNRYTFKVGLQLL